jgi:hypothetical protein
MNLIDLIVGMVKIVLKGLRIDIFGDRHLLKISISTHATVGQLLLALKGLTGWLQIRILPSPPSHK